MFKELNKLFTNTYKFTNIIDTTRRCTCAFSGR